MFYMARPTKDQQIIKQNPNKSPYELKLLGLSDTTYNQMVVEEQAAQTKQPERAAPTIIRAKPTVREYTPPNMQDGMGYYVAPNGKATRMTYGAAERLARKTKGAKVYPA